MEKKQVPAEPGRLIGAVARIGYDTEVALCDLIDNSIDADARRVRIALVPEHQPESGETDTIATYLIGDDGVGMDAEGLVSAFALGSSRNYSKGSLGKFGIGLKSAGLGLGNRVILISKTREAAQPTCAILSLHDVQQSGKYEVDVGELPDKYRAHWQEICGEFESGTLLVIDDLNENQPGFSRFLDYLKRYCSLVYHMFLEGADAIEITVNDEKLRPRDPLFLAEATHNGPLQPQDWEGTTPHILLTDTDFSIGGVDAKVCATHLIHPPSFGVGADAKRDEYLIEADPYTRRARHGFYIYRNRRIIVMAERFNGLIPASTQSWAFRGRLMFEENADNILSLDVKKRHCQLPKAARSNLQSLIKNHSRMSTDAWRTAGAREMQKRKATKEDVANQSIGHTPVADLKYAPGADLSGQGEILARESMLKQVGEQTLEQVLDPKVDKKRLELAAQEKSVVMDVQGLKGNSMWLPYPAMEHGSAETLVNHQHSWVAEAYSAAEDQPIVTLILHQLLTILARAELEVRSTPWPELHAGVVDKVMERFRRKASAIGEDLAESLAVEVAKFTEFDKGSVD